MKLIIAASAIALSADAAFEQNGGSAARWKMAKECVTMKDNGNTFARLYVKPCDTDDNKGQNFKLLGDGMITDNSGQKCLYFNPNTKLYTMAKRDNAERYCKTANSKENRFTLRNGQVGLTGITNTCARPQDVINKKYNKVVNSSCTTTTTLKDFDDKTKNNNAATKTYSNAIYNAISDRKSWNSNRGPTIEQLRAAVKAEMGAIFLEENFTNQMAKNFEIGTLFTTVHNNVHYYKNTVGLRPLGEDKPTLSYPKRIWSAMASSNGSFKNLNTIQAVMRAQQPNYPADKDKIAGIIARALDNKPSALVKGVNGTWKLKDINCKKGLNGVCNNKETHSKLTTSWNKMISMYFKDRNDNADTGYKTPAQVLAWIKTKYKDTAVQNGPDNKGVVARILASTSGETKTNVQESNGAYRLKDPKCRKGLLGICDNDGDHDKKAVNYNKIITTAIRALANSATYEEIIAKAKATHPNASLDGKKIASVLKNNIENTKSNVQINAQTKKVSMKDPNCKRGLKGICDNSKKN